MFESVEKYQQAEGPDLDPAIVDRHHSIAVYRLAQHMLGYYPGFNIYREADDRQLVGSTYQQDETTFWGCHWATGQTQRFDEADYKWVRAEVVEWIVEREEKYLETVLTEVFRFQ